MTNTIQTLDYAAIAIYMAFMAGIGIFFGWYVKDIGQYFKGGGTIPWFAGGISNFMSMFSTFVFVAHAGIAYEYGLVALLIIWSSVPPMLIAAAYFAKRWRRAGISSPVEFMEVRFNASVRQVFSWGGVLFRLLENMVRLYAIGLFIAAATPLSLDIAIVAAGVIVVIYTVTGGLWAVIITDAVQFIVLICSTLILIPLTFSAAGGLNQIIGSVPDHFTLFNGPKGAPFYLLAYYVMIAIKFNGNWAFIQRFYSVKNEQAGRKMGIASAVLFLIFPLLFLLPPIAARVILPELSNPEMAYVSVALEVLPTGIMGILLAAMFAATMSSLDSEYNVVANVITNDIYKRKVNPSATDRELMNVARVVTLLVGGLVIGGAFFIGVFGGAFEANKLLTALFAIPLIIPVVMGVLFPRPKASGAIASLVAGVVTGLLLNYLPYFSWELSTLMAIGVCLIVFFASGYVGQRKPAQEQSVQQFFERLRTPVPTAEQAIIDPAFYRSIRWLFAIALACTGLLFIGMSLPSVSMLSGQLTLTVGIICCTLGGLVFWQSQRKQPRKPGEVREKTTTQKMA
ncbi:MAG: sodium/solute symporter [Bacteroidota bacterium]